MCADFCGTGNFEFLSYGNMLESKKPSQFIKKLQSNEVELNVQFLDETTHKFSVKVSTMLLFFSSSISICCIKDKIDIVFFFSINREHMKLII